MTALLDLMWVGVCSLDDLLPERGVRVLVGREHVALFRLHDGRVRAISDIDPFCGASVLSRGLVGSRGETPIVASPMYKQTFSLDTGRCLDDPDVHVAVYPVRVAGGRVLVGSS